MGVSAEVGGGAGGLLALSVLLCVPPGACKRKPELSNSTICQERSDTKQPQLLRHDGTRLQALAELTPMHEGVGLALHRFEMGTQMGMGSLHRVCTVTSPIRLLVSALMSSSAGQVLQVFAIILLVSTVFSKACTRTGCLQVTC